MFIIYMKTINKKHYKTKTKKQFLFNPNNYKKSFDVYIDKNPKDTINIKYTTIDDIKNTIHKLEQLYKKKKYTHKRIWQVGMIMKVRLEVIIEMRFLNNETKPLKELFKNSLLVFFSSLCGIYILSNMNSNSLKPAKQSTEIFTGTPEF